MGKAPVCIVCGKRPAAVPDRNAGTTRFVRKVCRECHGERLRGDLREVMSAWDVKRAEWIKQHGGTEGFAEWFSAQLGAAPSNTQQATEGP